MVRTMGLSKPVSEGAERGPERTSIKVRKWSISITSEAILVSSTSPGLAATRLHGQDSVSRTSSHEFAELVESKEINWTFSNLKNSLLSHKDGSGVTLGRSSEINSTFS